MALITTADKNKLYTHVKHELGYPLRPFELKDEMMDSYLEMVIEDYSSLVNSWLIQQQWTGLEGLSIENGDFLASFTTKSNDYMKSFTLAYSKQIGLGTNAPAKVGWELKRDFFTLSAHTQHYLIKSGREINQLLWETPNEIDMGLIDPFTLTSSWSAGVMGWSYLGRPANLVQPTYSILLSAQDRRMKQRVLQSTLSYRITGLETGEKLVHLYPIPNSRMEIKSNWNDYVNRKVWYWYYDTNKKNRDKCLDENPDIVILSSDVPTKVLKWDRLNDVAKQQIRNLLIAKVKMAIGNIRGYYGGEIGTQEMKLILDYKHLLDEGIKLKEDTEKIILDQLEKLRSVNLSKERADIGENLNTFLSRQPLKSPFTLF
jgi:hypothetical protein